MPLIALAIGAGVGLIKSEAIDRPREERQRKLKAETQRYSPWTGMQGGNIQEADPFGSALAFGSTGAQIQSGLAQQQINEKLADRALQAPMTTNYNFNPYSGPGSQFAFTQGYRSAPSPIGPNPYGDQNMWLNMMNMGD